LSLGGKVNCRYSPAHHSTLRPAKPYPDFPLYAHATGRWAKKIRGKLHYFGHVKDGWKAALDKYDSQKDALHAGKRPRVESDALTLKDLANDFLNMKQARVASGELSPRTMAEYVLVAKTLVKFFGDRRFVTDLLPDDYSELRNWMAKKWGLYRLGNSVKAARSVFKFAFESGKIDKPVRFGPNFSAPNKKTMRIYRSKQERKLFTAQECRDLIEAASVPMRAMVLLGLNCAFGNADCANLPLSAIDLAGGWVNFPRPKTGVERRCPLWPETISSIQAFLASKPVNGRQQLFVTKDGNAWGKEDAPDSPIGKEFKKLMKRCGISGHRSFYALRHTHRTASDGSKDQVACHHIMGHEPGDMSVPYREHIDDARLKAVSDHVRGWLFGTKGGK
jgi:integrase